MGQRVSKLLCSCFDREKVIVLPEQYKDNFNKYDFGDLIHDELSTLIQFYIIKNS